MKHKKYHLIYFFSLLFFILSLVSTTTAQTSYLDSLDGKYALQFQISENFTLTNFQGAILSGKYQLGKRSAIRLGVSLNFRDDNKEGHTTLFDTLNSQHNIDQNNISFTINSQYIAYMASTGDIGFYFGSGPSLRYGYGSEDGNGSSYGQTNQISYSRKLYSIGLDFISGVEWCFTKNFALSAEYGIKFYYYHETVNYTTNDEFATRTEESTEQGIQLTANYVNFGISVYF